ncbi:uncharacterized protein BT62DRAFT_931647 [Guyanagaster necrorhizus]|uniref:Uncharacterized protein n=1 Tax=Guyanagaster necrorhizus TaxID=856835 RepID=A0A9P7VUF8_9AGAR|nr:uncharacterized protein BT62DRAFT_931647 [Guyanagaster necrorhizus MCA 3950]KAG7447077.1 hypothetical protein BT62DRAFT_931647 [Guyanagaster necrorhizus MCA 3950]
MGLKPIPVAFLYLYTDLGTFLYLLLLYFNPTVYISPGYMCYLSRFTLTAPTKF